MGVAAESRSGGFFPTGPVGWPTGFCVSGAAAFVLAGEGGRGRSCRRNCVSEKPTLFEMFFLTDGPPGNSVADANRVSGGKAGSVRGGHRRGNPGRGTAGASVGALILAAPVANFGLFFLMGRRLGYQGTRLARKNPMLLAAGTGSTPCPPRLGVPRLGTRGVGNWLGVGDAFRFGTDLGAGSGWRQRVPNLGSRPGQIWVTGIALVWFASFQFRTEKRTSGRVQTLAVLQGPVADQGNPGVCHGGDLWHVSVLYNPKREGRWFRCSTPDTPVELLSPLGSPRCFNRW
ncbi:hypothetical protein RN03_3320 [Mycobacterium tuberculosis]|nr:hypothetical protein RN03_3320 [Mycobacterium tuberculosis]